MLSSLVPQNQLCNCSIHGNENSIHFTLYDKIMCGFEVDQRWKFFISFRFRKWINSKRCDGIQFKKRSGINLLENFIQLNRTLKSNWIVISRWNFCIGAKFFQCRIPFIHAIIHIILFVVLTFNSLCLLYFSWEDIRKPNFWNFEIYLLTPLKNSCKKIFIIYFNNWRMK